MICLIYKRNARGLLEPVTDVTVADASADPESAAWQAWTRGKTVDLADYAVFRQGKAFSVRRNSSVVTAALGPVTVP